MLQRSCQFFLSLTRGGYMSNLLSTSAKASVHTSTTHQMAAKKTGPGAATTPAQAKETATQKKQKEVVKVRKESLPDIVSKPKNNNKENRKGTTSQKKSLNVEKENGPDIVRKPENISNENKKDKSASSQASGDGYPSGKEYFGHNAMSFYDFEIDMAKDRIVQPNSKSAEK